MKPRARRVTSAAAVLGAGVIAVFVGTLGSIRDHVEAWWFQRWYATWMIEPKPAFRGKPVHGNFNASDLMHILANYSGCPVVFDREERHDFRQVRLENVTANLAKRTLEGIGFRVLDQRFPRRAYVVIRDEHASREMIRAPDAAVCPRSSDDP